VLDAGRGFAESMDGWNVAEPDKMVPPVSEPGTAKGALRLADGLLVGAGAMAGSRLAGLRGGGFDDVIGLACAAGALAVMCWWAGPGTALGMLTARPSGACWSFAWPAGGLGSTCAASTDCPGSGGAVACSVDSACGTQAS
jgi:hypothetical protein